MVFPELKPANRNEATLNRILKGRVHTCKLDTLEAIAGALGYELRLVKAEREQSLGT